MNACAVEILVRIICDACNRVIRLLDQTRYPRLRPPYLALGCVSTVYTKEKVHEIVDMVYVILYTYEERINKENLILIYVFCCTR